jgi:hypothetical protein
MPVSSSADLEHNGLVRLQALRQLDREVRRIGLTAV